MGFCCRARAGCSARWPCSAPIGIALAVRECPEVRICTCSGGPRMAASRRAGSQPFADGRLTTLSTAWMTMGASSRGRRFSSAFRRKTSFRGSDILRRRRGKAVLSRGRRMEARSARLWDGGLRVCDRACVWSRVAACARKPDRLQGFARIGRAPLGSPRGRRAASIAQPIAAAWHEQLSEVDRAQKWLAWADDRPGCCALSCSS